MAGSGSEQLRAIAAHCKELGDRGLMNRTRATLRVQAAPLIAAAKAEAVQRLPKRGGLNKQVAGQRWTVQSLAGARSAGVRLRTVAPDTLQTDDGYVRHPTPSMYGYDRSYWHWVRQELPQAKGWASDTVDEHGPVLAVAISRTLDLAAAEVARAAGGD